MNTDQSLVSQAAEAAPGAPGVVTVAHIRRFDVPHLNNIRLTIAVDILPACFADASRDRDVAAFVAEKVAEQLRQWLVRPGLETERIHELRAFKELLLGRQRFAEAGANPFNDVVPPPPAPKRIASYQFDMTPILTDDPYGKPLPPADLPTASGKRVCGLTDAALDGLKPGDLIVFDPAYKHLAALPESPDVVPCPHCGEHTAAGALRCGICRRYLQDD